MQYPGPPGLSVLWPKASVVIFDVEGTLVDAVPLTLRCWQETLVWSPGTPTAPHPGADEPVTDTP